MQTIINNTLADTMYYGTIPVFIYHIAYPSFTTTCSQAAGQKINDYYAQQARATQQYCRSVLYPQAVENARYIPVNSPPFNSDRLDAAYTITYNAGCITSLYMDTLTFMGGAHGELERASHTWDFNTGMQLQLNDIYPLTPSSLSQLQHNIEQQITDRLKAVPGSYFDNYALLLRNKFNQAHYYLQPGSYVIYYQEYDIAPYVTGIPVFAFPRPG